MKNKKAQNTFNIFTFMITAFLIVVFFASLIWVMGMINDVFHEVGVKNDQNSGGGIYVNMTQASDDIFGKVNDSIQALRMVSIMYILGLGAIIIVTNALQKRHPIWFFAYMLIALLAIVFAPTISNAYENLLNSRIMDGTLSTFTASNFILLNLPTVVLVISILGGVFLFIQLIRTEDRSGGLG